MDPSNAAHDETSSLAVRGIPEYEGDGLQVKENQPEAPDWRPVCRISGWLFVLLFCAFGGTADGFRLQNLPPFCSMSYGELMLWMGHVFLLIPGSVLLGLGYSDLLARILRRVVRRIDASGRTQLQALVVQLFVVGAGLAFVGNATLLSGLPVTDDEYAVKFGGQVLATGHLLVPEPTFMDAIPTLFFFRANGWYTSMDWLGPQVAWAFAEVTGSGNLVWALLASFALACTTVAVGRRLGPRWALAAAAFFACSPMALALSVSSHAHLASRAFVSLALVFLVNAVRETGDRRAWFLFGLAAATSFVCRPFESGFLFLPVGIDLAWRTVARKREGLHEIGALLAGAALPLAVFATHSWLVTGSPLVPPRFVQGGAVVAVLPADSTWARLGNGVAFNAVLLGAWFLGPLGVVLAMVGAWTDRYTRLLALGIGSVLLLGLFHDNYGIHTVGPIHYSECVVPLTILATQGLFNIWNWTRERRLDFAPIASVISVVLIVALGAVNLVSFVGLRQQADIQEEIYGRIDALVQADTSKAIVLAPKFDAIWRRDTTFTSIGSWVWDWRRPRPDYNENVMILYDLPGIEARVREVFPDRRLYRVVVRNTGTDFDVVPVAEAQATPS